MSRNDTLASYKHNTVNAYECNHMYDQMLEKPQMCQT